MLFAWIPRKSSGILTLDVLLSNCCHKKACVWSPVPGLVNAAWPLGGGMKIVVWSHFVLPFDLTSLLITELGLHFDLTSLLVTECVCMQLNERMVWRVNVSVLHRFHATWVGKLSYSQVTSIHTTIRLVSVCKWGRKSWSMEMWINGCMIHWYKDCFLHWLDRICRKLHQH